MEEVGHWDDGEQPLAYVEVNHSDTADPLQGEMVAVAVGSTGTEAPEQGSPSPRTEPTPGSSEIQEIVRGPETYAKGNPENESAGAIQDSLNSAPPTSPMIGSFQSTLGDTLGGHFLPASSNAQFSSTGSNSMMAPLFTTLTEQERNRLLTDMIINCIRQQSAIWDSSDPSYGDSKLCQLLWNNIASVCGIDVKKLKNRWYTLKSTYKKEFIKCTTKGVSSKSPNFGAMSFLEGEIVLELKRESSEKDVAKQQLQRIQSANSRPVSSLIVLDSNDDGEDEDDCVILESEQYLAARNTLHKTLNSDVLPSSRVPGWPLAVLPKPVSTVRPKGSSSQSSPEDVSLGASDSHTKTKKVVYSTAMGEKPIIKFASPVHPKIIVEEGMPQNWNVPQSSAPTVVKQCAKKSTSWASYMDSKSRNGIGCTSTPKNQNTRNSTNLKSEVQAVNKAWRIENPRTVGLTPPSSKPEREEPTNTEPPETEPTVKLEPMPEEDEIQIIKEIPGNSKKTNSAVKVTGPPKSELGSKRAIQSEEQAAPKKRRLSDSKKVSSKREVDKTRENSANEHFLLSLMCDVESLTNKQFRRLKMHSTSLAAMILDTKR